MAARNADSDFFQLLSWDVEGKRALVDNYVRLQGHPQFELAAHTLSRDMLNLAAGDKAVDGVVKDLGRYVATMWAMGLHCSGGLTLPRLKQACTQSGLLSPGRARAVLLFLRHLRMIEPDPVRLRGEAIHYVPTATFLETWRSYIRASLESACLVEPAARLVLDRMADPQIFKSFARIMGQAYLAGSHAVHDGNPAFARIFLHRHAGMQIIHSLLESSVIGDGFPPTTTIPPSIAAMARRLHVSRTHVKRALDEAEHEGLLGRGRDNVFRFHDSARIAISWVISTQLIALIICAARCARENRSSILPDIYSPALKQPKALVSPQIPLAFVE